MTILGPSTTAVADRPERSRRFHAVAPSPDVVGAAIVFVVALVGAIVLYHRMWAHPATTTIGSPRAINDQMQSMWFLRWIPWRLAHGHNPFRSDAIDYPLHVNLAWNTSTPTLAMLAAPLTFTAGAAFSYNTLMTLAPAVTSLTGFLWLRRYVGFAPAAAVGGLVIAFSSFEVGHLRGHLHLAFAGLVPLMLLLFEDVLWRKPEHRRRSAVWLGLVTAAQVGISEELIVITASAVVVAMLSYLVVDARALWAAVRASARSIGLAVLVMLVAASPLLVMQFLVGDVIRLDNSTWQATVDQYLWPTGNQAWLLFLHPSLRHGGAENAAYIGVLMLIVLGVGILLSWRDRLVRCALIVGVVLVLATFGSKRWHGIPVPWNYIERMPGFTAVLPLRFGFAVWFVIAWLLARFVDRLASLLRAADVRARVAAGVALAAVVVGLVTWVPRWNVATALPRLPHYLAGPHRELPRGSLILLLPASVPTDASGMYVQQEAGFWFVQPTGYAYRNGAHGGTLFPPGTPLVQIAERPGHVTQQGVDLGLAELRRMHYRAVVVIDGLATTRANIGFAERLLGRRPDINGHGDFVWLLPG